MSNETKDNQFAAIREAGTDGTNFGVSNDDIIAKLTEWQSLCSFSVSGATGDTVDIEFVSLPADMDAFVRDLYKFCPDVVDQGTGCVHEMMESMEEAGEELPPEWAELVDGIDFSDENYGLEILKRELQQKKELQLWWD